MDLLATLRRSGGINALARQVDLPPSTVSAGVEALLPALLSGLRDYARTLGSGEAGIAAMLAMIDGLSEGNLAADVMGPGPLDIDSGERLLAHIFGSRDAKHRLGKEVGRLGGMEPAMIERILPPLAMLVSGYISARVQADQSEGHGPEWLRELLMLRDPDAPLAGSGTNG